MHFNYRISFDNSTGACNEVVVEDLVSNLMTVCQKFQQMSGSTAPVEVLSADNTLQVLNGKFRVERYDIVGEVEQKLHRDFLEAVQYTVWKSLPEESTSTVLVQIIRKKESYIVRRTGTEKWG